MSGVRAAGSGTRRPAPWSAPSSVAARASPRAPRPGRASSASRRAGKLSEPSNLILDTLSFILQRRGAHIKDRIRKGIQRHEDRRRDQHVRRRAPEEGMRETRSWLKTQISPSIISVCARRRAKTSRIASWSCASKPSAAASNPREPRRRRADAGTAQGRRRCTAPTSR